MAKAVGIGLSEAAGTFVQVAYQTLEDLKCVILEKGSWAIDHRLLVAFCGLIHNTLDRSLKTSRRRINLEEY